MSFIGGYQSNFNLSDLNVVGDFPIDHSLGGFGIGIGVNNYAITLNTAIAQYRQGLLLQVAFTEPNTGPVQVNVSNRGFKALKKPMPGGLQDLDAGDISNTKIYLLVYDGQNFQVANFGGGSALPVADANEDVKGIAQIATLPEVLAGVNNSKIVTPAKLAAYLADKITGLWKDKGLINCSGNPNYPPGLAGEAYTVSGAGKIGGAGGQNVGLRDVIYCNVTNPGGTEALVGNSWTILQANLEAATELIAGYVRLANVDEMNSGESMTTAVSPRRLKDLLDSRAANEALLGLIRVATQPEVNAGAIDTKAVTPLKLATLLNTLLRFQNGAGVGSVLPRIGEGNSATGLYAAVLGGQYNQASGAYSIADGLFAVAALFNEWAKASGAFFNTPGSSQYSILNLLVSVPPGGGSVPLTTDGNAPGAGNRWLIPNNCIQRFAIHFTITQNAGGVGSPGLTYTAIYEGAVRNQNGIVNWIANEPTLREVHQDVGFAPAFGFLFSPGEITMYLESMVERTLHVSATIHITQTKFDLR